MPLPNREGTSLHILGRPDGDAGISGRRDGNEAVEGEPERDDETDARFVAAGIDRRRDLGEVDDDEDDHEAERSRHDERGGDVDGGGVTPMLNRLQFMSPVKVERTGRGGYSMIQKLTCQFSK